MDGLDFKQSESDPCLFCRGYGEKALILCIYVDDDYCIGKMAEIKVFLAELGNKMNITIEESMDDYLSCEGNSLHSPGIEFSGNCSGDPSDCQS